MLSVRSNLAAAASAGSLRRTQSSLGSALGRISSGRRIQRAADDAAGLGVATNLETRSRSLGTAMRNANDGISVIQVLEQAASSSIDLYQRMRGLAVQAASETLDDDERAYLDDEFTALIAQADQVARSTEWNGKPITAGFHSTMDVQVGIDSTTNDRIQIRLPDLRILAGIVSSYSVGTVSSAQSAIGVLDSALDAVIDVRAEFGAKQNRLDAALNNLQTQRQALTGAASGIIDADYAQESSRLASLEIIRSAGFASLSQAKDLQKSVLSLL